MALDLFLPIFVHFTTIRNSTPKNPIIEISM